MVWCCQQRVGRTGIIQALRRIRFNAWKKSTECWEDLILERVSHLVFGLEATSFLCQGEISFNDCCVVQELKEVVRGGVVEESKGRAGAETDMLLLPDCWQMIVYCRCHKELSGKERFEAGESDAFDFGMMFCQAWDAAGEVARR